MRRLLCLLLIISVYSVASATSDPKQLVEREFRQLEAAIAHCIYESVLPAPDLERMTLVLYEFMRDNPSILRILRTNAGGHTVNDVSADMPHSALPRDIGNQRWFRGISRDRRPYYSMNVDTVTGDITLFYAWPLMTGPDRDRFSGAFAAMVDFTSQAALVYDAPPFQIAYLGRAFFQHDWENVDYNETTLEVRGTRDLTIRTMRPIATRLDPVTRTPPLRSSSQFDDDAVLPDDDDEPVMPTPLKTSSGRLGGGGFINIVIFILLALIAAMLAYSIFGDRRGALNRFIKEDRIPLPKINQDRVIIHSMMEMPAASPQPQVAADDAINNTVAVAGYIDASAEDSNNVNINNTIDTIVGLGHLPTPDGNIDSNTNRGGQLDREQQAINKILKLVKEELVFTDKKIQTLSQRISELEKKQNNV